MHFTLLLQMTLASKAGRAERFIEYTLKDEAATWRALSKRARARAREITTKETLPQEWIEVLGHLDSLSAVWDFHLPMSPA